MSKIHSLSVNYRQKSKINRVESDVEISQADCYLTNIAVDSPQHDLESKKKNKVIDILEDICWCGHERYHHGPSCEDCDRCRWFVP